MKPYSLLIAMAMILLSGCGLFSPDPLTIPENYDGSAFSTNASAELALLDQFKDLVSKMKEGRDEGVTFSVDELGQLFLDGSPSISDQTNAYYRGLVDSWLVEMASASGNEFVLADAPQGNGGVLGGHLFDEHGLELEQMIDKGLFGSMMYSQANLILNEEITPATADRILALWGAHPDFVNSDNSSAHTNADRFSAKYAARRDQNDGIGFYTSMEDALIQLQAASANSSDYAFEVDQAVVAIREIWEAANAATIINYLYAAIDKLSQTNPSDAEIGSALHSYSEAVGFLHGWRQLPSGSRLITDDQVDKILGMMEAAPDAVPQSYLFARDPFTYLSQLEDAVNELQLIYGFTNAELESFKKNWVNEQGR